MRAAKGTRTLDPQLGKLMLYQLSYYRICDCKGSHFPEICKYFVMFS